MAQVEIRLKRVDRIYYPGETLSGVVAVTTASKSMSYNAINLEMEGKVSLQLSAKSVGLFEAFYHSLKPIDLVNVECQVAKSGKIQRGTTEFPFEFKLEANEDQELYETYHGVFINIQYTLKCECVRGMLAKNIQKTAEFIVQTRHEEPQKGEPVPFTITPEMLENVKKKSLNRIPKFKISGKLNTAVCDIAQPFTGQLTVEHCDTRIKSIELQLVRVETCGCADGFAKEATEIQNIQVGDGDVCHKLPIPLFMVFPRLFTAPTLTTRTFKIQFEVNIVVMLHDGHLITENFPIRLYRQSKSISTS